MRFIFFFFLIFETEIHIETDSSMIFHMFCWNDTRKHSLQICWDDIEQMIQSYNRVWLPFAYREANFVANALAKHAMINDISQSFIHAPPSVLPIVCTDNMCI